MLLVLQSISLIAQAFALFYVTRLLRLVGRPKSGAFVTVGIILLATRTLLALATDPATITDTARLHYGELALCLFSLFLATGTCLLRGYARRKALARLDPNVATSLTAGPPKEAPGPREGPEPSADVSTEPLLVCNGDMEVVEANQSACRLLGCSREDIYGKSVANLVRKEEMLLLPELFRLARAGETKGGEWTFRRPDDSLIPVRVTTRCRFKDSVRLTLHDISEERAAQQATVEEIDSTSIIEQLLDATPNGYVAYDPELKIIAWNAAMEKLTGIPRAQCLHQHLLMHFPIPDELAEHDFFLEALEGHSHDLFAATLVSPTTGEAAAIDHHFAPLRNPGGEIIGGMVVVQAARPTDEAKPADEALEQVSLSEFLEDEDAEPTDRKVPTEDEEASVPDDHKLLQAALDAAPHVISVFDLPTGRTVYSNRQLPALMGFNAQQIAEMGDDYLAEIVHPEDQPHLPRALGDWNDGTGIEQRVSEFRVADPQLNWRWFQSADRVLARDEEGNITRIVSIIADITDRKNTERDLRLGEQKFRAFSERCPTGIWHLTTGGATHYLNPAMCRLLGVENTTAMEERTWHEFLSEESRQRIATEPGTDSDDGASTWPVEIRHADGTSRHCLLHGAPEFEQSGELRGLIASVIDVSEHTTRFDALTTQLATAEAQQQQAEDERTALATQVEELRTNLREQEQSCARVSDLETRLEEATNKLDERETQLAEHGARVQELEAQINTAEASLRETEEQLLERDIRIESLEAEARELGQASNRANDLEQQLGERDTRLGELESRLITRDQRIGELESLIGDRDSQVADLTSQRDERQSRIEALEAEVQAARTQAEETAAQLHTHEVRIGENDAHARGLEGQLKERNHRIEELEGRLRDEQWHLGERDARIKQLEGELHDCHERIQSIEPRLTERDQQVQERDSRIDGLELRLLETEERLDAAGAQLGERDARITELERQETARVARVDDLESQLTERATRIGELETQAQERDTRMTGLEEQLHDRDTRLETTTGQVRERDVTLAQHAAQLVERDAQLAESNARLDSLHDCIWGLDPELRCNFLNRAWRERTGCGDTEDLGDRWRDRIFGQDRDRVVRAIRAVAEKREPASFDCRLSTRDGSYRWTRCHVRPRLDAAGNLGGLLASAADIHEHMTAEQDLRTTLRWHEWAQKSARLGSWEYHPQDDSGFWNDTSLELLRLAGRPSPERLDDYLAQVHPDDRAKLTTIHQQVLKTGQAATQHVLRTNPDHGPVRRLCASIHRAPEEDGSAYFLVGTLLDITALQPAGAMAPVRSAEPAAARGDDRYRRIVELAGHGVWMMDAEGYTSFVNPAMIRLLGRKYREFVGRHFFEFLESESTTEAEAFLERRAEGLSEQAEFRLVHRAGHSVNALLTTSPLKDDDGEIIGSLCMVTDVTAWHEKEISHSETESRSRAILDQAPGYVMTVDAKKFIRYTNRSLPGIAVKQLVGTPLLNWASPADRDALDTALDQVFNTGEETAVEFHGLGPDEETVRYAARLAPVHKHGEVVALAIVMQTLGERPEDRLGDVTRHLLTSQEDERRRVAAELHDLFGQSLSATKLNLEALPETLDEDSRARVADSLASVNKLIARTRDLGAELRPSVLDDLGLEPALRWLVAQRADSAGFAATFSADKLPRLHPDTETGAYRVVESALTNAVRHSKAKNVAVELRAAHGLLQLTVTDDGKGFNPHKLKPAKRRGLEAMTARAHLLDGEFELHAEPRKGTTVLARLPLTKPKSKTSRRKK